MTKGQLLEILNDYDDAMLITIQSDENRGKIKTCQTVSFTTEIVGGLVSKKIILGF